MKKLSKLMVFVISVFAFVTGVNATEKNEVTTAMMQFNERKESVSDGAKKSKPTK